MRRTPLTILGALASFGLYLLIRELGHLVALSLLRLPISAVLRYGCLPAFEVGGETLALSVKSAAWVVASGPMAVLAAGYILLAAIAGGRLKTTSFLRLLGGLTCYLALVLDPIYYTVIPLFNMGGEPETLAYLLGVSLARIEIGALALLVVNAILTRRIVVPFLREADRAKSE